MTCPYCGESLDVCICDEDDEMYNEEDDLPPVAKPLPDIDISDLPF